MKKCLICECDIKHDGYNPINATIWRSHGNYGSTLFDNYGSTLFDNYGSTLFDPMMDRNVYLEGFVCDKCLKEKKALIEEVRVHTKTEVVNRKEPDFDV